MSEPGRLDLEHVVVTSVARACARGGARLLEFTNRGDLAWEVFRRAFGRGTVLDSWSDAGDVEPNPGDNFDDTGVSIEFTFHGEVARVGPAVLGTHVAVDVAVAANDFDNTHGHEVGDVVLRQCAALLRKDARTEDVGRRVDVGDEPDDGPVNGARERREHREPVVQVSVVEPDRALHAALAPVVRRQREVPVAEHAVQPLQVVQRGAGRGEHVAAAVREADAVEGHGFASAGGVSGKEAAGIAADADRGFAGLRGGQRPQGGLAERQERLNVSVGSCFSATSITASSTVMPSSTSI